MNKKIVFTIGIFCFISIQAQVSKDSLLFSSQSYSEKLITNSYEKQLNTHNYNTLLKYFFTGNNFFFGVKENFISTVIKTNTEILKMSNIFGLWDNTHLISS